MKIGQRWPAISAELTAPSLPYDSSALGTSPQKVLMHDLATSDSVCKWHRASIEVV